jgi:PBP1b-binding outer membrane lipoprotein LpoB
MRVWVVTALLPLALGGCLSYSAPPRETVVYTPAPATTTTVVPPGSVAVCANGLRPPC